MATILEKVKIPLISEVIVPIVAEEGIKKIISIEGCGGIENKIEFPPSAYKIKINPIEDKKYKRTSLAFYDEDGNNLGGTRVDIDAINFYSSAYFIISNN